MLSVKSAYHDRNAEAKKLLDHIASISESGSVVESSILKSSYTLLLYNCQLASSSVVVPWATPSGK